MRRQSVISDRGVTLSLFEHHNPDAEGHRNLPRYCRGGASPKGL